MQLLDLNSLGGSAIIVHFCDHILAQLCFVFGLPSFLHCSKMMKKKANEVKANEAVSVEQVDILISENQALQIYLKHHDNVYKTP